MIMTNKTLVCEFLYIEKEMTPSEFFLKNFDLQKTVESHHQDGIIDISLPSLKFNYNNQSYKLLYNEIELNNNVYSISISLLYENNKEKHAIILDKVMGFINNRRNHNFNLIFTRNDSLKYFSIRLYKLLYDFETNLRSLVKIMLIPDNKQEWHKVITSKVDVTTKLSKTAKIEKIIEELSITDLELMLFDKTFPKGSNLFEDELSRKQVEKLTRQEIINVININRPASLWDTYFSHYIEYDVMNAMKVIKTTRNNAAHYREFDSEQYKETLKVLNKVNPLIKNTIKELQSLDSDVLIKISQAMEEKVANVFEEISKNTINLTKDLKKALLNDLSNDLNPLKSMVIPMKDI
ncbi:lin0476 [Listeria innocua Clip11262]|uniref:Lin0476 protein n=3 Tax=Listeria innocua TaxID=1642 RepID=Q92EI3_LISIN|nr:lin0476 [Listeria innocua Clip11262]